MMQTSSVWQRLVLGCNRCALFIAELALLLIMLLTGYAVIARYVFESPSVHSIELSVYLLLVSTWGAMGWTHHVCRYVSMEALNVRLRGRMQRVSQLVSELTVLVFCVVLVGAGSVAVWNSLSHNYRSTSLLEFPLWIPYALIPVGALLLGLVA